MEKGEDKIRKITRQKNLQNIILAAVATAGVLGVSAVAPGVFVALKKLGLMPKPRQKESIYNARNRLIDKGYLKKAGNFLEITKDGRKFLNQTNFHYTEIKKPKKWDKKWRVLIFDIPEKRKNLREKLRNTLNHIGFIRLQDSVWVYPYNCEDLIALLKSDFHLGKDLLYLIVDHIENDKSLRLYFKLNL